MKKSSNWYPETKAIHAGTSGFPDRGAVTPPIYQTSTFQFRDTAHLNDVLSQKVEGDLYTRYSNPSQRAAERTLAALEKTEAAMVLGSGMAAITTTVLGLLKTGDTILTTADIYGGTYHFFHDFLPRFGIKTLMVASHDADDLEAAVTPETRMIYIESPSNPLLNILPLADIARLGQTHGCYVVIDNTFATPVNQTPVDFGIDIILHSATKYLGGHSDIIAGAVAGPAKIVDTLRKTLRILGPTLDPFAAWLMLRGMKTLTVRIRQQNKNTQKLAEYLENHPRVKQVYYPGLPSHPHYKLAKKQMRGFGGVLSFEIEGTGADAEKFIESVEMMAMAPSLGAVETLITQPVTTSHRSFTAEDRKKAGISDSLVRIAVGIEHIDDLIADCEKGFAGL
jgi:cystathionine beta-lyase/cystathionine gamma-synthase